MEAGAMTTGRDRSFGERLANTMSRVDQAPFVLKAAAGVLLLDLILVLTDRFPDSGGEWILLLAIYALSVAAMVPLERNPAALAGLVSGAASEPLVIPCLNRDGDLLSDLVLPLFGSIAGAE
ncbi:MAG: hypothetical protein ABWZ43_06765, partial [Solirubrobacterales bacterium]